MSVPEELGNCYATCIASLLGIRLETMPNFCALEGGHWMTETNKWLSIHGIVCSTWNVYPFGQHPEYAEAVTIASGKSPRGPWNHSVIWKNKKVLWDPHPSRAGLAGEPTEWDILLIADASKLRYLSMDTVYEKASASASETNNKEDAVEAFKAVADVMVPSSSVRGWNHLQTVAGKITPLIEEDGKLFRAPPSDIFRQSFTWVDEKPSEEATGLEPLAKVKMLHHWGHYSLFKPSVSEVLPQIPGKYLDDVVAFSLKGPDTADDFNKESVALNAGFHVSECTLYRKKDA